MNVPVTEQPDVATKTEVLTSNSTNTLALTNSAKVEVGSANSPGLATPTEANSRSGFARVRVVTLARIVDLRAGDLGVEGLDSGRRTVDDGGAGIDDGLKVGDGSGRADDGLCAGSLPETCRSVDGVVFDRARVFGSVCAAEEEVRA